MTPTGTACAGSRCPGPVRADSRQALRTRPDVMLLPAVFAEIAEIAEIAEGALAEGRRRVGDR
ncbi:DUF5954 family protein [Streptomyces cacaoi]|uniref:DUF5954 family protein n=1 Tax=Streptomyces cacaoi TaxID=1898 RepID=UPI00353121DA